MKIKSIVLASLLAIVMLSVAAAKSYIINLASPMKAGGVALKAGEYKLAINGNKITFTDEKSNKSFTTDGKIETSEKSYPYTRVDSTTDGGTTVVKDIELGGSKLKIDF